MAIETVDARARGFRPRQEAVTIGALLRRLDWILLAGLAATVAYGLVAIAAITRHDPGGSALHRQALYAGCRRGALLRRPGRSIPTATGGSRGRSTA